jgi:MFS family permease
VSTLPPSTALASKSLLVAACVAVGFAAADTYVVVLALPDMMASLDLPLDELQRAAPIVSGFLLGYVAVLPLIGRIADLRGRVPVLVGSLVIFAVGSLVTAASYDLESMVAGRFFQGVGGGGLVPATLALVADLWPAERRGLPLGVVGAVQELGSVVGPLYGALVLAVSTWQTIFWINLAVGLVLAATLLVVRSQGAPAALTRPAGAQRRTALRAWDWIGALLGTLAVVALALVMAAPDRLTSGINTGLAFIPYVGDSRWSTAMAFSLYGLAVLFVVRQLTARAPLVNLRGVGQLNRSADLPGAALLGVALAGVVLAFASADPEVQVFSPLGEWFLVCTAVATGLFWWRQRRAEAPLVPTGSLRERAAWGSILVSFFVGASLIAALVDIPIFARVTIYPDDHLAAALVLVRFLAALPVGALLGGYLTRRYSLGWLAAGGMLLAGTGFAWFSTWGLESLRDPIATVPLVLCGLGFGISIAPVNAALLAATRSEVHGLASALLVVARMVGMLVGISALTTIGLRRFFAVRAETPTVEAVCGQSKLCAEYRDLLKEAGIAQLHAIFVGAAIAALIAALLSVVLLRQAHRDTNEGVVSGFGI